MKNAAAEKREPAVVFEEKRVNSRPALSGAGRLFDRPVGSARLTGIRLLEALLDPIVAMLTLKLTVLLFGLALTTPYLVLSTAAFLVTYIVFKEFNICRSWRYGGVAAQLRGTILAWTLVIAVLLFLGFLTRTVNWFPRSVLLTWVILTPPILIASHAMARALLFKLGATQRFSRSVVVVGLTDLGERLAREMQSDLRLNMVFSGFFDDRDQRLVDKKNELRGRLQELPAYVKKHGVDLILITLPMAQQKRILDLLDQLRDTTASIYFAPDLFMFDLIQARMDEVNGIPVVAVCETPFYGLNALLKRILDIIASMFFIVLLSPLLIAVAILVKVTSRGPILFRQRRYGLDGEEIIVYKFRSMRVMENDDDVRQATKDDDRITPIGKYLRQYSLDELPQFINVLQGRMSVVGPRPHAVAHNEMYRRMIKGYMMRHKVKPGITGWAQVNGLRGETDTVDKMKARIEYDLDYLRNWSLWLDIKIIFLTAWTMLRDKNAY